MVELGEIDDRKVINAYRKELAKEAVRNINGGKSRLMIALMTLGKTYLAGHLPQWQSKPVTVFTRQWSTRFDIEDYAVNCPDIEEDDVQIAPSFKEHCDSYDEDDHPEWVETIDTLTGNGATASKIHKYFGDSDNAAQMPCQEQDGKCTYSKKSDFEAEGKKLIIASPQHAYVESYTEERVCVFDEDPGQAYETEVTNDTVTTAINQFLTTTDGMEDNDHETLDDLENMNLMDQVDFINELKHREGGLIDPELGLSTNGRRADTPLLIIGELMCEPLSDGVANFCRHEIDLEGRHATYLKDSQEGGTTLRVPPALHLAGTVLGLDGTPVPEMWNNRLGHELETDKFLTDEEREEYINDILQYDIYQTSHDTKPASSGEYVNEHHNMALLEHAYDKGGRGRNGEGVAFITSRNGRDQTKDFAENEYDTFVDNDELYFGALKSSNAVADMDTLVLSGSKHPGDREIQRLAALDGYDIPEGEGRGNEKTYGEIGDRYYAHVTHHMTAQAIFRIARDEDIDGADIYVHTSTIPDWVPVTATVPDDERNPIHARSEAEQMTMKALMKREIADTATIAEMSDVGERQVRNQLKDLEKDGHVESETDRGKTMWIDDELRHANWWGEVRIDDE